MSVHWADRLTPSFFPIVVTFWATLKKNGVCLSMTAVYGLANVPLVPDNCERSDVSNKYWIVLLSGWPDKSSNALQKYEDGAPVHVAVVLFQFALTEGLKWTVVLEELRVASVIDIEKFCVAVPPMYELFDGLGLLITGATPSTVNWNVWVTFWFPEVSLP